MRGKIEVRNSKGEITDIISFGSEDAYGMAMGYLMLYRANHAIEITFESEV